MPFVLFPLLSLLPAALALSFLPQLSALICSCETRHYLVMNVYALDGQAGAQFTRKCVRLLLSARLSTLPSQCPDGARGRNRLLIPGPDLEAPNFKPSGTDT